MSLSLGQLHAAQNAAVTAIGLAPQMTGKGIVTSIYDKEFASGWVLLSELAALKVTLPIEVWYKTGELSERQIEIIKSLPLDLEVRLLEENVTGWAIKPFSIFRSKFKEILWIDSDNVPIRDPSFLFEDEEYIEKGSLFWRDVSGTDRAKFWHQSSPVWTIFNVPYNDAEEFDAGQLLINKEKCWSELALTLHFNQNKKLYWQYVYGDKDTFRLSWQQLAHKRTGKTRQVNYHEDPSTVPYGFMPYGPFHIGPPNPWGKWGGGSVMQQRDRAGEPLFNHRTVFKFKLEDGADDAEFANATLQDARYVEYIRIARELLSQTP